MKHTTLDLSFTNYYNVDIQYYYYGTRKILLFTRAMEAWSLDT